jgi:hypothetical protein
MNGKNIIAIDPGPTETAWVIYDPILEMVMDSGYYENGDPVYAQIDNAWKSEVSVCAIEMVACYGMAVGAEIFETAVWIGKYEREAERCGLRVARIKRLECKMTLCHDSRAKDSNIRQALIDRFGPVGTKKLPGKLYGISGDKWAALAVAVTQADKNREKVDA